MSLISLSLAVAAFAGTYDCTLDVPKALNQKDGRVTLDPIRFPGVAEGSWKFRTSVKQNDDGLNVEVIWPDDPIQIAGKFAGLITADGSVAFTTYAPSPCMFSESMCMSLVHLVDHGDGKAKVIITPAALATDNEANTRSPFVVLIEGVCTRTENPK